MDHVISLQISTTTFLELVDYLREYADERDPSEIATLAIGAWLAMANGEVVSGPTARGYQWKDLFLPERTEVRMFHGANYTYAKIIGDLLVYGDRPTTPSQFVAHVAGARRNAWRDLWIRLPGWPQWKKAGFCRQDQKMPPAEAGVFGLETRPSTSSVMANSLKNALALVEKAAGHRHGLLTRRTDVLPDD